MGTIDFSKLFIYRWRYYIGYFLIAIGILSVLFFTGLYLPGGLSNQEIQSVIRSSSYNLTDIQSMNLMNFPYYILQHASIVIFGVSILSIKLPSIILSFFSTIGIILILKLWFKPRIAILASLIAMTTGQFLFIAQNGTPSVMYLFWAVSLILIASLIPLYKKYRKLLIVLFFIFASLSLYTPLSFYVIVVIAGSIALHPHLRYVIKRLSRTELIIGGLIIFTAISPLIISIINTPRLILTLLGLPNAWPNIGNNLAELGNQYFNFMKPGGATAVTPFFELGSVLIIALGAYYIYKTKATAKSYVVILWTVCLIPVIIINPDLATIAFLPFVLLLASGLNGLLAHWYELFPRNPYARIGGLVPIVILVTALVVSGVNRYVYGYLYDTNIVPNFSNDISLIPKDTTNLVVDSSEFELYNVVAKYNKKIRVTLSPESNEFVASQKFNRKQLSSYKIERIITTARLNDSNRFYLYKKITD